MRKSMFGASAEAKDMEPTKGGPSSMGAMMMRMTPWKRMPVTSTGAYSEPPSVNDTPSRRRAFESHTVSSSTTILFAGVSYSFTAFTSGGASPAPGAGQRRGACGRVAGHSAGAG